MFCPCKDCLVFVKCKQQVRQKYESQVVKLAGECPLLKKYLLEADTYSDYHTTTARKIFDLKIEGRYLTGSVLKRLFSI